MDLSTAHHSSDTDPTGIDYDADEDHVLRVVQRVDDVAALDLAFAVKRANLFDQSDSHRTSRLLMTEHMHVWGPLEQSTMAGHDPGRGLLGRLAVRDHGSALVVLVDFDEQVDRVSHRNLYLRLRSAVSTQSAHVVT